jgi:hypothetical protein
MENNTIANLAEQMINCFERRIRGDATEFWALKEGAPDWMQNLCREAHAGMLPDHWRYEFIVEALTCLGAGDTDGETLQADIFTYLLTDWLDSRTDRYAFCDQCVEDGYGFTNTMTLLANGQITEKKEVFELVKASLEAFLEEQP